MAITDPNPEREPRVATPSAAAAPVVSRVAPPAPGTQPAPLGAGPSEPVEKESEVWSGRTSAKHYAGRLCLWFLANVFWLVIVVWLASNEEWITQRHATIAILAMVVVSGLFVLGPVLWRIWGTRYRLTTQRLFIERGIFARTTDQTELIRVDDVRVHQSFLDRVFGLGTVALLTTDATDREVTIEGISECSRVAESIRSRMRQLRSRSLFVENL